MIRRLSLRTSISQFPPEESDSDSLLSGSSCSSVDDDEVNIRVSPNWCNYRRLIESRGFRLDTFRDVKQFYQHYWDTQRAKGHYVTKDCPGYIRACSGLDEDELCKDAGLVRIPFMHSAIFFTIASSQKPYFVVHLVKRG